MLYYNTNIKHFEDSVMNIPNAKDLLQAGVMQT